MAVPALSTLALTAVIGNAYPYAYPWKLPNPVVSIQRAWRRQKAAAVRAVVTLQRFFRGDLARNWFGPTGRRFEGAPHLLNRFVDVTERRNELYLEMALRRPERTARLREPGSAWAESV